jgi:nucleotidyltransferase/DNA polymerase involved in DNA repair
MIENSFDAGDAALSVRFFLQPVQNNFKTGEEGRPIFDELEYVEIGLPGGREVVSRPAKEDDKLRFPQHYAFFKAGESDRIAGLPIQEWPLLSRAQVEELKGVGIRSVEQLAAVSDAQIQQLGGFVQELKYKAVAYLTSAKDSSVVTKLAAENEELKEEIRQLKVDLQDLTALFEKEDKKKR